jgi:hypothetical protein
MLHDVIILFKIVIIISPNYIPPSFHIPFESFPLNYMYIFLITTSLLFPTHLHEFKTNVKKTFFFFKLFHLILCNFCEHFKYQSLGSRIYSKYTGTINQ